MRLRGGLLVLVGLLVISLGTAAQAQDMVNYFSTSDLAGTWRYVGLSVTSDRNSFGYGQITLASNGDIVGGTWWDAGETGEWFTILGGLSCSPSGEISGDGAYKIPTPDGWYRTLWFDFIKGFMSSDKSHFSAIFEVPSIGFRGISHWVRLQ